MGDLPPIAQLLLLDPVSIGDKKYTRADDLRRALGISFGSTTEDNSFGASHLKFPSPLATEELKRLKESVLETSRKARFRGKRFDECLHKLNKYCEGIVSRKQQRNEMLTNDRSGGSNLLRIGTQVQRDASHASQRQEDRPKTSCLNKRVRSSVTETRADGRSSSITRHSFMGRDKDFLRDGGEGSDIVEENIRRLPAGGESWDRKMKRKRSVAAVFTRPSDNDGEAKRLMHHKLNNEPSLQPLDSQSFRSGTSNGPNSTNNLDGTSLPHSSNARVVHKNELEKVSLSRDSVASLNKERFIVKGKKLSAMDHHILGPIPLAKGKASARGPRSGLATPGNLTPNFTRSLGALDGWDHPSSLNKVHSINGMNNRKRQLSTASSSPPMAQWVGQRSQKVSRTRRANLVSPVPNHDEVLLPSEGCSPSEFSGRMASPATNGSLLAKGVGNRNQQNRIKHEIGSSPARLSESEESGAGENHENRLKDKGPCNGGIDERAFSNVQNNSPSMLLTKKNKILTKEDDGDSVRRQGRSGRETSLSRQSISPLREKLDTPSSTKLLRSTRPGSEKNGRRPLKKLTDRKALTRAGHTSIGGSFEFSGESEDDHEELLAAAKYASNARNIACSSAFWRKMESVFAPVSLEDESFLKEQLKYSEENNQITTQIHGHDNTNLGDLGHEENSLPQILSSGVKSKCLQVRNGSKHMPGIDDLVDQAVGTLSGELALERSKRVPPLYQRVLSALIAEDTDKEFGQENDEGENRFSQFWGDDFHGSMHVSDDNDPQSNTRIDELESTWSLKTQKQFADRLSCNGSTTYTGSRTFRNQLFKDELVKADRQFVTACNGVFHESAENGLDGPLALHMNASAVSSQSLEDRLLLELQSIGLFPETVPDLADGEDDSINQEILELEKELTQKISRKENHLNRIIKEAQEGREIDDRVHREQVAMDRLIELAYRKLVATRGSIASKMGVPKVPKPVALAFMKRTVARCRRFEDKGESCFNEPGLRDALLAPPTCINDIEPMDWTGPASVSKHDHNVKGGRGSFHSSDLDFAKTGPISNRGKKKEVLLDDVGGSATMRAVSDLGGTLLGGAKGKRSERERGKDLSTTKKSGRPSTNNLRGERKTKTKPKQKRAQLSPSRNNNFANSTFLDCAFTSPPNEVVAKLSGINTEREPDLATEFANLPLPDLDSIELGDANDLGSHQDLSSWLNFDDDGLQGDDFAGLEIPMDDLSELNLQI